jgi:hypothetical protein
MEKVPNQVMHEILSYDENYDDIEGSHYREMGEFLMDINEYIVAKDELLRTWQEEQERKETKRMREEEAITRNLDAMSKFSEDLMRDLVQVGILPMTRAELIRWDMAEVAMEVSG